MSGEAVSEGIDEALERALEAIATYGGQHADTYAGVMRSNGGGLLVGFTGRSAAHRRAVDRLAGSVEVEVFDAQYSLARLRETVDLLSDQLPDFAKRGIEVTSIGVDTVRNRVIVGVRSLRDDWIGALEEAAGTVPLVFEQEDWYRLR